MARKHKTHRRRKVKSTFLPKLLCTALVLAAVIGALTMFFKVETILVEGNEKYSPQEIIEAAEIQPGDNLYLMNKFEHAQAIFEKLPYAQSVSIKRKLPDTLIIEVEECAAAASIPAEGGSWLLSASGKLLEQRRSLPDDCIRVTGCTLCDPEISGEAAFDKDNAYKMTALKTILSVAEEKRMRTNIKSISLGDDTCIQLTYTERFTVKMPWTADIAYKLESLATVVDNLEANEIGEINLMADGKASFIPQ